MEDIKQTIKEKSGYLSVLAHTQFRYLWFGQICSQLASNMLLFVLALRIYHLTGSNTAVSGLFLTFGIPAVLFGILSGTIVDHLDNKWVLMVCDGVRAVVALGLLLFSSTVPVMYVFAFFHAVVTQFYVPAEAPTIPWLVPKSKLITANSLFSFTFYSSMAVGSIVAGPTLKFLGPQSIFLFISILFLLAFWFVSHLPKEKDVRTDLPATVLKWTVSHLVNRIVASIREGMAYVKRSPILTDAILLLTGTQVIIMMLGTLAPGFADRVLHIDVHDASVFIIGPVVLGIILGAIWTGNVGYKYKSSNLIQWGILGAGCMLLLISFAVRLERVPYFSWFFQNSLVSLPLILFLFFLLGVSNSLLDVPANSLIQGESTDDVRGRVYGILTSAIGGVGILPVILSGILADTIGVGKVIFLLGIVIFFYGIYRMKYNSS